MILSHKYFEKFTKTFRKRRHGEKQKAKNNQKPEIEFQYAETYLKEIENCDEKLEDRDDISGASSSLENEKCQDYVTYQANNFTLMGSNFSRNIGYSSVSKTFILL